MEKKILDILALGELPPALEQEGVDLRLFKGLAPSKSIIGSMKKGTRVQLSPTPGYSTLVYIISGAVSVNKETVTEHHLIVFEKENEELIICAQADTRLLFLSTYSASLG